MLWIDFCLHDFQAVGCLIVLLYQLYLKRYIANKE